MPVGDGQVGPTSVGARRVRALVPVCVAAVVPSVAAAAPAGGYAQPLLALTVASAVAVGAGIWCAVQRTRLRRRRRSLRETDRRYRAFHDHAPIAIMVSDREHRVLDWNRAAESLFGWTRDEVLGRDFFEFMVPGDEVPGQRDVVDQTFVTARATTTMSTNLRKDGRRLDCDWSHSVITDARGEVTAVVSMALDLTAARHTQRELRSSERRFRSLAENAADMIATMRMDGRFTYVSPAIERLMGYTPEEFRGHGYMEVTLPEDRARIEATLERWRETGDMPARSSEIRQVCKDGRLIWVQVNMALLPDQSGQSAEIISVTRDITEQRRQREELLIRRAALECCADAVVISTRDSVIEYANPAFYRLTGQDTDVVGMPVSETMPESMRATLLPDIQSRLQNGRSWQGEFTHRRPDGCSCTLAATISPVMDADGTAVRVVAIMRDVSERRALQGRLEALAHNDTLTGLPNRRLMLDRLAERIRLARRTGKRLALLFIDLDGFKEVNDRFGHAAGDELLRAVAGRFGSVLNEADTLARMAGDEFTALLGPLDDTAGVEKVAERLIATLEEPITVGAESVRLGASVGVAYFPDHAAEVDELLGCADQAMYAAKRAGRNRVAHFLEACAGDRQPPRPAEEA